jgi:hypothetical protein
MEYAELRKMVFKFSNDPDLWTELNDRMDNAMAIDYRPADEKKNGETRGELSTVTYVLIYSFRISRSSSLKNEPLKRPYHKEDKHLSIFCVFFWDSSSNISKKYQPGSFWEYSREYRKSPLAM